MIMDTTPAQPAEGAVALRKGLNVMQYFFSRGRFGGGSHQLD